jgi:hypothetical protein
MGNIEFIPSESGKLQTKNTTEDLSEYLEEISEEYDCAAFASAYELIPYLGAAFNGDVPTSYMVFDEYSKDRDSAKEIINRASSYVRDFYSSSLAVDLIDGADPVYSRKAALWVDSSSNVKAWSEYYPDSLYLLHIPCEDASNVGVPYISTYSLCVSKKSVNRDFAAEFAAFISYDTDAQLLIYRLENMTGLMPLSRNDAVWDLISDDPLFGHMASDFRQTMENAVYCSDSYDSKVFTWTNEYTAEFVKQDEDFDRLIRCHFLMNFQEKLQEFPARHEFRHCRSRYQITYVFRHKRNLIRVHTVFAQIELTGINVNIVINTIKESSLSGSVTSQKPIYLPFPENKIHVL